LDELNAKQFLLKLLKHAMTFSEIFKKEYYDLFITPSKPNPIRDRSKSFLKVFEELEKKEEKDFLIVETGCMRSPSGQFSFGDDGSSTYMWDKFVNYYDGKVLSVDIDPVSVSNCDNVTSDKTQVFCSDSVRFLWDIPAEIKIDFLYLDSFDFEPEEPFPSQIHHMKELCAVLKNIHSDSIIVVDDNLNEEQFADINKISKGGKAGFIKDFMSNVDAELLFDAYQIGWKLNSKPEFSWDIK